MVNNSIIVMNKESKKYTRIKKIRRTKRTRAKIFGTKDVPRLSVFRSNRHIWAQVINDVEGRTLISVSEEKTGVAKSERAEAAGKIAAEKCLKAGISKVIFDRGGAKYHGRIKAFAEAARKGGLKF